MRVKLLYRLGLSYADDLPIPKKNRLKFGVAFPIFQACLKILFAAGLNVLQSTRTILRKCHLLRVGFHTQ